MGRLGMGCLGMGVGPAALGGGGGEGGRFSCLVRRLSSRHALAHGLHQTANTKRPAGARVLERHYQYRYVYVTEMRPVLPEMRPVLPAPVFLTFGEAN